MTLIFDPTLIERYDRSGPRYTSYPTAPQFHSGIDAQSYRAAALLSNSTAVPLSVYVHVPFCANPCFYCGCNRVITRDRGQASRYVDALRAEIALQGRLFHHHRPVEQLHFGGGTPTFLTPAQIGEIMRQLRQEFTLTNSPEREYAMEIDPRTVDGATIEGLARLGFNRISLGVQDLDPQVQAAVNRQQSVEQTRSVVAAARGCGIDQISFDLIYGLPLQTQDGFARTIDEVIDMRPTRIAVYGYAHLPELFKAQRQIRQTELPTAPQRLALLQLTVDRLTQAGYVYIGMDHFALPDDKLVTALAAGTLHRNFQGYSSHADCDLIGLGVSAIGKVGDTYAQNVKDLKDYYAALDQRQLPVHRGLKLHADDRVRRDVIQQLMCSGRVLYSHIRRDHCVEFAEYFAAELAQLAPLAADGLLTASGDAIEVSDRGRLLVRNIAMVFDAYLRPRPSTYSAAI